MKTTVNILNLAVASFYSLPGSEGNRTPITADYTANMLQRTTTRERPDRVDYLFVERIARDLRNQYIAGLFARAKKALATRFSRDGAKQARSR